MQRLEQDPGGQGPRLHPGDLLLLLTSLLHLAYLLHLASLQLNLATVDESTGRMTGGFQTYAICGAIRRSGAAVSY